MKFRDAETIDHPLMTDLEPGRTTSPTTLSAAEVAREDAMLGLRLTRGVTGNEVFGRVWAGE